MEKEFEIIKPYYDEIKKESKELKSGSYFDGKFIEYIGYKLLSFLITVFSLTIAKPWADVLILDYKFKHTIYNGKRLKFEGKGSSLFVQRFKWYLLTIITIGIYGLWIPIKKENWIVSNIHFEDEQFKNGESYFDGNLIGLLGINLFTYLLTLVSFGLLFPFAICYKQRWIAKHTVINCKKLVFNGKTLSIIGHYLLWWILSIITFGIYGLWLPIKFYGWQVKNTHIKMKEEEYDKNNILSIVFGVILTISLIILLILIIPSFEIPKIISGDKKISDWFQKQNIIKSEGSINFDIQGTVNNEKECPLGYEYDSVKHYCIITYNDISKNSCDKLNGQFNKNFNDCVSIILKPSTINNEISCVNDWNEQDKFSKCYNNIIVQSFDECKNKNAVGHFYDIHGNSWCTISVSNDNLNGEVNNKETDNTIIDNTNINNNTNDSSIKKNDEQSVTGFTSQCNYGYVFNSFDNMCYSLNDYVEPITDCSNAEASCGISCSSGYKISWEVDIGLEGMCYKVANPNY